VHGPGPERPAPSSRKDDEGVRVVPIPGRPMRPRGVRLAAGAALGLAAVAWLTMQAPAPPDAAARGVEVPTAPAASSPSMRTAHTSPTRPIAPIEFNPLREPAVAGADPNDLASYVRPGDPEPSMANVIRALNEAGIRTGLGAFNPPGTSPPLEGLAVPDDFVLPPGYVRHHQVTDDGQVIEPILMYSPDLVLRDAAGRLIPLPANRVVPLDFAPPGLPLRWVRPGKP
jgi:hypothetical protein